jgi:hypothetical protein
MHLKGISRENGEKLRIRRIYLAASLTPRWTKVLYPGCTGIFEVLGVLSSFPDTANQEQREHRGTGRRFEQRRKRRRRSGYSATVL